MMLLGPCRLPTTCSKGVLPHLLRGLSTASSSPSPPEGRRCFDFVVCGGGLVGSAAALAIATKGVLREKKILVLEMARPKDYAFPNAYSNRVSAINSGSKKLFEDIGSWDTVRKFRSKPIRGMKVWDSDGAFLDFPSPAREPMFHIVENDLMVHSLSERLLRCDNVEVQYGRGVKGVKAAGSGTEGDLVEVILDSPDEPEVILTRLLIGADGANSSVRRLAFSEDDNPYLSWSYEQMGVVANLRLAASIPNEVAWQKFVAGSGPIALLPLSEDQCSLVWTLPTKAAQRAVKLSPEDFVDELRKALGKFPRESGEPVPEVEGASQMAAFPLGLGHSSRYCLPGVALVGDAAHRVHPLAGQGVNLGFGDAACLSRHLAEGASTGEPLASPRRLQRYETERQRRNLPVMAGIDFLQRVYSVGAGGPFGAARALGVRAVNSSPALKGVFAAMASG